MSYKLPTRLFIVTSPDSPLYRFWQESETQAHALAEIEPAFHLCRNSHEVKEFWATFRKTTAQLDGKLIIMLTDLPSIQKKAVLFKLLRHDPTLVMRWWDAHEKIKKNYFNRLLNRYTCVNFYPNQEVARAHNTPTSEHMRIDYPVCLDQKVKLGKASAFKVFLHTVEALYKPERVDQLGFHHRSKQHIRLSLATHFYVNQHNMNTLTEMLERYASYASDLLEQVQFVVVDDGSPLEYTLPDFNLNIIWIKINEDIPWNQAGARNLAMMYCQANNVILTDVDHSFPEHTLAWLCQRNIRHKHFYKFYRKSDKGGFRGGHSNIFYLSRARFFENFGADEEFSGCWGFEDLYWVKNHKYHGSVQRYLPKKYYCEEIHVDREKSYHTLVRDPTFNIGPYARKRMEGDYFGQNYGHNRSIMNFTWKVLMDRSRIPETMPKINKLWRQTWLLRQLKNIFI